MSPDELAQIDAIAQELGQSRAQWFHNLVRDGLGLEPVQTVRSLHARVKALEDRLSRLAK